MKASQILGWIVVALLVLFVAFNLDDSRVWLFGIRLQMPIALVVLVSAALGGGAAILFGGRKRGR
jgi:uncharacterized integral membrane protein